MKFVVAWLVWGILFVPTAARAEIEAEQVREAIKRGTQFLLREQQANGSWKGFLRHDLTSLCTLALLQSGVKAEDPAIQKALIYLRNQKPTETYEVALQTMVFCAAEPKKDAAPHSSEHDLV